MSLQFQMQPKYSIIRSDDYTLTEEDASACVAAIQKQIDRKTRRFLFIFDFENVITVASPVWRILSIAAKEIAHNQSRVAVLAGQDFQKQAENRGLDEVLPCYRSLNEILEQPSPYGEVNEQVLDVLNAVLNGTSCTIKALAGIVAEAGLPMAKGKHPEVSLGVAGTIGLQCSPFRGSLTLAFPLETYLGLTSRFFGYEVKEAKAESGGMVGELLNMIVGHSKLHLHPKHYAIKGTPPVIVQGTDLKVLHASGAATVLVPFTTDAGRFFVELAGISAHPRLR